MRKEPVSERLWRRVDMSGGPDACWPWLGCLSADGYGHISAEGKSPRTTHSVALELHTGGRPDGAYALHRCDNPCCCNPQHLFWGTHLENIADKVAKGRQARTQGEKHPAAKLTAEMVRELRARYVPWCPVNGASAIARELGMSQYAISQAVTGRGWRNA